MCLKREKKRFHVMRGGNKRNGRKKIYVLSQYIIHRYIFFQKFSTNGLILYFSVYKLPKGPPTFIACLVDVHAM